MNTHYVFICEDCDSRIVFQKEKDALVRQYDHEENFPNHDTRMEIIYTMENNE